MVSGMATLRVPVASDLAFLTKLFLSSARTTFFAHDCTFMATKPSPRKPHVDDVGAVQARGALVFLVYKQP